MRSWSKYAIILLGSLLIAAGTNFFLVPYKVLDGGIIGIALIINYLYGINIGIAIVVCSLPVFLLAWLKNRDVFLNSLIGLLCSSLLIEIVAPFQYYFLYYIELGPISSAIIGGFLMGLGLGLMLHFEASTGGTDLLAHFITRYVPLNVGVIIFVTDAMIIGAGGLLISKETFVHSLFTIASGAVATGLCTLQD
ncbi:YitT family protein [Paenibacillus sp. NPDC057934]|uniref:YitT family protein n=1 Tax=Paenibacillus sp. NPDC057934 TaxID=3346282 RepID=UPI0036DD76D1